MLKLTIPFTDEIVFNSLNYAEYQQDEVTVNRFDETRATINLSVKNLMIRDIAVFMIALNCPESVFINVELSNYAWVMMFTLSGFFYIQDTLTNTKLILREDSYHSIIPPPSYQSDLVVKGETKLFMVCLTDDTVKKLLTVDELIGLQKKRSETNSWSSPQPTTPEMHELIRTIVHGADSNSLHKILLSAKIFELVFLDYEHIKKNNTIVTITQPRSADLQKLRQAKLFISQNLQSPYTLIELAHKVGLNDFKLKKGFKEVFGTTVFGYLADLRMEKARHMLASAKYTVSEVAHEVGYKNAHHFTAAFKKKYGKLPSKINQLV